MNVIKALFRLLLRFVQFDDEAKVMAEGEEWWKGIRTDKETLELCVTDPEKVTGTKCPLFVRKLKIYCDKWYGAVTVAIVYLVCLTWLRDLLNPKKDDRDDDMDDDD